MSIAEVFHWTQNTGWATALRESDVVYPVVLSLHLSAIALFGGTILLTNLRLLGLALKASPVAEVVRQLRPWKWAGFFLIVPCGVLLASAKADTYYPNHYFRIKLFLLAGVGIHALFFRRSVYGPTAAAAPARAKLAACLSLALWLGILSMGRWIAYYEKPKTVTTTPSAGSSPTAPLRLVAVKDRSRGFARQRRANTRAPHDVGAPHQVGTPDHIRPGAAAPETIGVAMLVPLSLKYHMFVGVFPVVA